MRSICEREGTEIALFVSLAEPQPRLLSRRRGSQVSTRAIFANKWFAFRAAMGGKSRPCAGLEFQKNKAESSATQKHLT
jgi:hypothetical protein